MSFPRYERYKDSGVEWLGDVPEGWEITPLKYNASCNDQALPDTTPEDHAVEYVEISDVDEVQGITGTTSYAFSDAPSRARRVVQDGDVLISTVRTYLRAIAPVVNPPNNLVASTGFAVIRPQEDGLSGDYLGYLLRAEWWIAEIISKSVGVSYPAINASDLIGIKVPVPVASEQTQIASFLDHETARIDALIAEKQRLIELLKEKRHAVISHAVTKGLDPTVPMKDSEVEWLGEVPESWGVIPLRYLVKEKTSGPYGASLTKAMYTTSGYRVYGQQQVIHNDFSIGDYYISEEKFQDMRRYEVFPNDVLISVMGTVGRVSVVPNNLEKGIINPRLVRYKFKKKTVSAEYVKHLLMSSLYQNRLREASQGSTMEGLNMTILGDLSIVLPPKEIQAAINRFVDKKEVMFNNLIGEATSATNLLNERRSALISAAVTGKIDVRNWQTPASASVESQPRLEVAHG